MQVYADLVQSFYTVLALEKDLEHIDTEQGLYTQRIHDLNGRMAIGRSRPTEVLTVQTSEALLVAQREQVLGQLHVAREVLAFLTGLAPEIKLQDTAAIPDTVPPLETYLARLPQRPDLQAAQARVEAARENVTIAANAHLPSVDLNGDYYVDHSEPAPILVWDAQIALTLPVFSGFTLVAKTHQAESLLRQSENDLSQLNRLNLQEIRSDYFNVTSDLSQIAANKAAADMAEKNYRAVLKDYNLGLVTNLDVLVALQSDQDSLRALDKAIFSSKSDFEHLETAAAKRLDLYP
jgi:outer membrane protein